jgi:hypothetical protein
MAIGHAVPQNLPKNDPKSWTKGTSLFEAFGYKFTRKVIGLDTDIKNYSTMEETVDKQFGTFVPQETDVHLFNPDDPGHALINTWDQDAIFYAGLQMRYYKVKPIEEQKYYNETYGENPSREYEGATLERDKKFAFLTEQSPTVIYGLYSPEDPEQLLGFTGIDTDRAAAIEFNRVYINTVLGRDPVNGDVIVPWDLPEQFFEVMKVVPAERTLYVPRRFHLTCRLLQLSK